MLKQLQVRLHQLDENAAKHNKNIVHTLEKTNKGYRVIATNKPYDLETIICNFKTQNEVIIYLDGLIKED